MARRCCVPVGPAAATASCGWQECLASRAVRLGPNSSAARSFMRMREPCRTVACEQWRVVSTRRVMLLLLIAVAVGGTCGGAAASVSNDHARRPAPPQVSWRGLQASDGTTTAGKSAGLQECILCWMLALAVLAGAAMALVHVCRHKRAEQSDEVKTPLSATAASADPFADAPTSDKGPQTASLGAGLKAKGRFTKPTQSEAT